MRDNRIPTRGDPGEAARVRESLADLVALALDIRLGRIDATTHAKAGRVLRALGLEGETLEAVALGPVEACDLGALGPQS